jgi:TfoX/Sxy family transcriptional regulator of competence genes
MTYIEEIEVRIKKIVTGWKNTAAKKMFGGVCHLLIGNMFCGAYKDYLILRLGEDNAENALQSSFVRPFDITGRPMKGWVMVETEGFKSDDELRNWLNQDLLFRQRLTPRVLLKYM